MADIPRELELTCGNAKAEGCYRVDIRNMEAIDAV